MIKNACGDKVVWWLRSPGNNTNNAANVNNNGYVNRNGNNVNNNNDAVVPDLPQVSNLWVRNFFQVKRIRTQRAKEPYSLSVGTPPMEKELPLGKKTYMLGLFFLTSESRRCGSLWRRKRSSYGL